MSKFLVLLRRKVAGITEVEADDYFVAPDGTLQFVVGEKTAARAQVAYAPGLWMSVVPADAVDKVNFIGVRDVAMVYPNAIHMID